MPTGTPFFNSCKDNEEEFVVNAWNVTPKPDTPMVGGTAKTKPVASRDAVLFAKTYVTVTTKEFAVIVAVPLLTAALT